MNEETLLQRIADLGGLDMQDASVAARAVLASLGERVAYDKRTVIARELPAELGAMFRTRKYRGSFSIADFFERVRRREKVSLGFAREHAEIVCRALGKLLSEDACSTLDHELPEVFAELFRDDESLATAVPDVHRKIGAASD